MVQAPLCLEQFLQLQCLLSGRKYFNSHYLYPLELAQADGLSEKKSQKENHERQRTLCSRKAISLLTPSPGVFILKTLKK